jgi:hypothetical protein
MSGAAHDDHNFNRLVPASTWGEKLTNTCVETPVPYTAYPPRVSMEEGAEMLSDMLVLATRKHEGQYDKGGMPYILHPLKLMYKLKTDDFELMCMALGHDLIEDTDTTYAELIEMGFSSRIIEGIKALTKLPGQTRDEYKVQVKANPDAVLVKMQDLRHNSDLRRLKGVGSKDFERAALYMEFYKELAELVKTFN